MTRAFRSFRSVREFKGEAQAVSESFTIWVECKW
jgi:hypothetical protein